MRTRAAVVPLAEAVAELVHDGDTVALEGFTHLIPFAAGHEIIRPAPARPDAGPDDAGPRLRPDDRRRLRPQADLLLGRQSGRRLAAPHARRDRRGWPVPLEIEEHSHAGLANRYVAGAVGPALRRAARLRRHATSPPTAPAVSTVAARSPARSSRRCAALNPDVAIIHAQRADRAGNVQLWGISGIQKEAVLAAKRALVTVEEVVDDARAPCPARWCCPGSWSGGRRGAGRRRPVVRARLLRPRQRRTTRTGRRPAGTARRSRLAEGA